MYSKIKDILEKLIGFDTTISINTLDAVNFIKKYLDEKGVKTCLVFNENNARASLLATIGDEKNAGLLFSGHLDVVAADPDEWTSYPFVLDERDEKLYGRGTADMKGAIACILAMVDDLKATGKTFHFAFTHDEEGGFNAINQLEKTSFAGFFKNKPLGCIVMEPTQLLPICAHKGAVIADINVVGKAAHSAFPELGIDAIENLVDIYSYIQNNYKKDSENFETDDKFNPKSSTLTIAQMQGGDAINKISGNASLSLSARGLPNNDIKNFLEKIANYVGEINQKLQAQDVNAKAEYVTRFSMPAFKTNMESDFIKKFYAKINVNEIVKVSYGTEAGYFQKMGIDTIIFGPGNIAQAHMVDEYVEKDQLLKFCDYIKAII